MPLSISRSLLRSRPSSTRAKQHLQSAPTLHLGARDALPCGPQPGMAPILLARFFRTEPRSHSPLQPIIFLLKNRSTSPYLEITLIQNIFPTAHSDGSGTFVGNNDTLTTLYVIYDDRYSGQTISIIVTLGAHINATSFSAPLVNYADHRLSNN